MTDEQKVRAQFEVWAKSEGIFLGTYSDDETYQGIEAPISWKAWQAAISHASATTGPSRDRASKCPGGMECSTCGCIFIGDESHDECGVCIEQGRDVAFAKATVTIAVGREMFRFNSFQQWVNKAQSWFKRAGVPSSQFVCIDATGRICGMGKQLMSARDRGAFPVIVYDIDPATDSSDDSASATAGECSVVAKNIERYECVRNLGYSLAYLGECGYVGDEFDQMIDQAIAAKRGG